MRDQRSRRRRERYELHGHRSDQRDGLFLRRDRDQHGGRGAEFERGFGHAATAVQAASLSNAASNGSWSEGSLNAAGLAAISKTGTTQLRVYFNLDDNDDGGNDYIGYYSGDNSTSANRPQLVVTYQ